MTSTKTDEKYQSFAGAATYFSKKQLILMMKRNLIRRLLCQALLNPGQLPRKKRLRKKRKRSKNYTSDFDEEYLQSFKM
jgi:hypothetical protein